MRSKIARRKSWVIGKKLKKLYPGYYKVCEDLGYGDGTTIGEYLDICSALVLLGEHRSRKDNALSLSDLFSGSSCSDINHAMYYALDQTNMGYIVKQENEMVWEAADFDPNST